MRERVEGERWERERRGPVVVGNQQQEAVKAGTEKGNAIGVGKRVEKATHGSGTGTGTGTGLERGGHDRRAAATTSASVCNGHGRRSRHAPCRGARPR